VGTFGNNLIYTSSEGVWEITSGGVSTKIAPGIVPGTLTMIESPAVAPTGFGNGHGGQLFVTVEDDTVDDGRGPNAGVYYLSGGLLHRLVNSTGAQAPESIQFVPSTPCTLTIKGKPYAGFLSLFSLSTAEQSSGTDSAIDGFSASDISAAAGKAIITAEFANGFVGTTVNDMRVMDNTGSVSDFANVLTQLEGFSLITCNVPPPPPSHCTLTQGGYKNNFNNLVIGLTLGTVPYSASEVNQILQDHSIQGNGLLSLAHQLITADLNIHYGTIPSTQVTNAISDANSLIGALGIPPIGSDSLPTSTTSGDEKILDAFNNSNDCK
jgi:hypothetical protein